jgi:hypothetical protein
MEESFSRNANNTRTQCDHRCNIRLKKRFNIGYTWLMNDNTCLTNFKCPKCFGSKIVRRYMSVPDIQNNFLQLQGQVRHCSKNGKIDA